MVSNVTGFAKFLSLGLVMILAACNGGGFTGKNKDDKAQSSGDQQPLIATTEDQLKEEAGQDTVKGGEVEITPPTEEDKKEIGKCLTTWGRSENPEQFESVRKIKASVSVGGSGVTLQDQANTSGPALTLIYAGVNVGGTPTWELLNPNGWYCMVVNVNVGTEFTIKLAQNAKLADSKVSVNVGSQTNGDATSAIGVNVGSNVTVIRQ